MKNLVTILSVILLSVGVFAQAPQKMSYQAVIRNNSNVLITNTIIRMQISILLESPTGLAVYTETQTPTTNTNGLSSIEIGGGTPVSGSFEDIDWSDGPFYLRTEIDPTGGSNYTISGTSQLMSVPYALYAEKCGSGDPWLTDGNLGTTVGTHFLGTIDDEPLMFKVNNVEAGYIDYAFNKANTGFGYQTLISNTTGHSNTANGYNALLDNTTGLHNTAIGKETLRANSEGNNNIALGSEALSYNTTGSFNVASGTSTMRFSTIGNYNTAIGTWSLYDNTEGSSNSALGTSALRSNVTGNKNTAVGYASDVMSGNLTNATAIGNGAIATASNEVRIGNDDVSSLYFGTGDNLAETDSVPNMFYDQSTGQIMRSTAGGSGSGNNWALLGNALTQPNTYFIGTTDYYPLDFRVNDINAGRIDPDLDNTFFGIQTGNANTTGIDNTAIGLNALQANLGGAGNTATGSASLFNTTGKSNTGFGFSALSANTSGSNNTAIGYNANVNSVNIINNSTALGSNALVVGSDNMILGNNIVNVGIGLSGISPGPQNKLEINAVVRNASGLRFRRLTSASTPITTNPGPGVLTVDASGDVIYVEEATGSSTLNIGDAYQGGIIFWLDDSGQHGLIAAIADQSTGVVWTTTTFQSTVSNAVRDGVNGGFANTERIIIQAGEGSYAAQVCANYQGGGYGDWYLPSKYELNLLFLERTWFSGFVTNNDYWSSSEGSNYSAWVQYLSGNNAGSQAGNNKNVDNNPVRAIRAF